MKSKYLIVRKCVEKGFAKDCPYLVIDNGGPNTLSPPDNLTKMFFYCRNKGYYLIGRFNMEEIRERGVDIPSFCKLEDLGE